MTRKYARLLAARRRPWACGQCGSRPKLPGKERCQRCIDRHLAARHRRVAQGGCIGCSAPATPGRQRCEACTAKALAQNRAREAKRREAGLCTRCGERPARHTRRRCDECLVRDAGRKGRKTARGLRAVPEPPAPVVNEFYVEGEEILGIDPEEERLDRLRWRWLRTS